MKIQRIQINEFKARLIMIDVTHRRYAEIIGVSERTVTRWLNESTIPSYAILSIEALEHRHKIVEP
jgi:transcriptional regulator with XRE-family HTH domain